MSNNTIHTDAIEKNTYYRYDAVPEVLTSDELGTYVSFAVRAVFVEETTLTTISDVSTELAEVQHLAALCTDRELDPEQLPEVIEDFLNGANEKSLRDKEYLI